MSTERKDDVVRTRLALLGLAKMLREEFPERSIAVIVDTWSACGVTEDECQAIRELEVEGAFDD